MRAALINGPGGVTVGDVAAPAAGGHAIVRVDRAGVCGTDLKIAAGQIPVSPPRIMGHEIIGRVEEPGARGLVPSGTRVLVNPGIFCGRCDLCRRDLPNLCRNGGLLGRDVDGGFAEFLAVDEAQLHPIPEAMPPDDAALLQVLSTCVHAQSCLPAHLGDSAVVVGLGVSGLLHVQLLRARGVETIVATTRSAWKRELALRFGATAVAEPGSAGQVVEEATDGRGADMAIECAGTQETLAQTMHLAGPGGTVLVFGTTAPAADRMPTYEWYHKELTILNPRAARPRDCDLAISLGAELDLASLVTGRFPLARTAEAVAACQDPAHLKIVLDMDEAT